MTVWPQRGLGPMPPTDPLMYRLYEVLLVFGQPLKAVRPGLLCEAMQVKADQRDVMQVIHEKFGDGIMSAIVSLHKLSEEKES